MTTQTKLGQDVLQELEWEPGLDETSQRVSEEDGIVTLEGHARSFWEKDAAVEAAQRVAGVRGLISDITLTPRARASLVKEQIDAALRRYAEVDAKAIRVETHDGDVTLRGVVRSWPERAQVERAAWAAPGVVHIDNEIIVAPATPS